MAQKQIYFSLVKHAQGKIALGSQFRCMSPSLSATKQRQFCSDTKLKLEKKSLGDHHNNNYYYYNNIRRSSCYFCPTATAAICTRNVWSANNVSFVRSIFNSAVNRNKTEGDLQFIEFINSEIDAENKEKVKVPTEVEGFAVATQGPKVTLTKTYDNERITVTFNVNDSVVSLEADESTSEVDSAPADMVSQPDFHITLEKTGSSHKLQLKCRMVDPEMVSEISDDESDLFEITEMAMTEGEWDDSTYYVSAELLDPTMYDMLMSMLERRGIDHGSFVEKMTGLSTSYEHKQYVNLLHSFRKYMLK